MVLVIPGLLVLLLSTQGGPQVFYRTPVQAAEAKSPPHRVSALGNVVLLQQCQLLHTAAHCRV